MVSTNEDSKKDLDNSNDKNMDNNQKKCGCACECCTKTRKRMSKIHPVLATVVFVVLIATSFGLLAAIQQNHENEINSLKSQISELKITSTKDNVRANGVSYKGQENKTALEILKEKHEVLTKDFGEMGKMVISIDGVEAKDDFFWGFYVDGKMANEGADKFVTNNDQNIQWKFDKIQ